MTDYDILKYLGLEIKKESLIFYDDDETQHSIAFSEIKEISFENVYMPIVNRLAYWVENFFVIRSCNGMICSKSYIEDYRKIYELEILLNDNRIFSRKVRNADVYECEKLVNEINNEIN